MLYSVACLDILDASSAVGLARGETRAAKRSAAAAAPVTAGNIRLVSMAVPYTVTNEPSLLHLTTLQSPHKNFKLVNKSEEKNSKIVGWFRAIFESRVRTLWRREGFTCQALQHAGGGGRVLHVQLSALVEVNQ